jgi:hypothetical protein
VAATPVIIGVVQTATDSDAIRIGVMWPCAAVYGFALALAGVRLAAVAAANKMPELCQVAVRSAMTWVDATRRWQPGVRYAWL